MNWAIVKVPTVEGIRFYLQRGNKRRPGGFAKWEKANDRLLEIRHSEEGLGNQTSDRQVPEAQGKSLGVSGPTLSKLPQRDSQSGRESLASSGGKRPRGWKEERLADRAVMRGMSFERA